jgi:hypothetical protein
MKRYPLLSVTFGIVFLLASASAVSTQQKSAGEPLTVGILLLNKPYMALYQQSCHEAQSTCIPFSGNAL